MSKPELVPTDKPTTEATDSIAKPEGFDLDRFKSKRAAAMANVETLLDALPVHTIAQAKDFVRLHPEEDKYWSSELCFVNVPIKGSKRDTLHLIEEELAMRFLPSARIQRFRLALATKPYDVFFLCHVPSQNLDNKYNETSLEGCMRRRDEGVDAYHVQNAVDQDAFPPPKWPSQALFELIDVTFSGRMIETANHPALLR